MKYLERLRKMVTWAAKNDWIEKDPFKHYQLKFKRTERDYLGNDELLAMESFDLSASTLQVVRDFFIFSCYTGLSYIDLIELKPQQIISELMGANGLKVAGKNRCRSKYSFTTICSCDSK